MNKTEQLREFIINLLEIEDEKKKVETFTDTDLQLVIGKVRMWQPDVEDMDDNSDTDPEHEDNGNLAPGVSQRELDRNIGID